jgi:dipeptidyl aminopeptidase/acylaminoacyl peptidase
MATLQPVTPEIVERVVLLEEVTLGTDGGTAYIVRRSVEGIEYRQRIWAVPMDGSEPWELTHGPTDTQPRVSPDGATLAFLGKSPSQGQSHRDGPATSMDEPTAAEEPTAVEEPASPARATSVEQPRSAEEPRTQVWVLPLSGGEPRQLTCERHDVSGFCWSPDGERIAFWGWRGAPRFLVGERDDGKAPTARRITRGGWRWNEIGHVDYRTHVSTIDLADGATAVSLTDGEYDVANPAWDPDGRSLVFAAARHDLADLYPRTSIWRVGLRTRDEPLPEPVEVVRLRGYADHPAISPDGRWLAVVGVDEDGLPDDAMPGLFVAPADGSAPAQAVARDLDLPIGAWEDADLTGWNSDSTTAPFWRETADGPELVALVTRAGRCDPWRFPLDAGSGLARARPEPLATGDAACWQLSVAPGGRVAVIGTLAARAMEVMEPAGAGTYRTVTRIGSAWQQGLALPRMKSLSIPGPAGPIETWLALPAGQDGSSADEPTGVRSTPLALVVDFHGGPLGAWAPAPWLEVQILTSAGFAVALPNIRGSTSYGRAWVTPHLGHWGDVDATDAVAVVEHLVRAGVADPARLGLLGLSYGGFLVNWLVGAHPGRFAAAVSENGVTNQINAWANSDSGPAYNRGARLGEPFDDAGMLALWRQSPLRLAPRVTTPLLMLQGEADLRCAPQDNEQLFLVLRAMGKIVEYVLYPESAHTYAVTGRPDRRKDRHARMLEWFQRYLG